MILLMEILSISFRQGSVVADINATALIDVSATDDDIAEEISSGIGRLGDVASNVGLATTVQASTTYIGKFFMLCSS